MNLVTVTKHQNIALEEIKKALPQRIAAVVAIHGNHAHIASNDPRVKKIKWSEGSVKFAEGEYSFLFWKRILGQESFSWRT